MKFEINYLIIVSVLLLLISAVATGQTTPCNNERLLYLQQQDTLNLYESDELVVLQAECIEYNKRPVKYSPCNEPILLALQQKDTLSAYEVDLYIRLLDRCDEYTNKQIELQQHADRNTTVNKAYSAYVVIGVVSIAASLIYYLTIMNKY